MSGWGAWFGVGSLSFQQKKGAAHGAAPFLYTKL